MTSIASAVAGRLSMLRRCRYGLETALVYAAYGLCWLLPRKAASGLGGFVAAGLGPRMGVSRVARRNLDLAFPDKSAAEKKRILRGMWDNLGRIAAEYPHLHHMDAEIDVVGIEHMEAVRDSGRPALLFSGHIANWELPAIRQRTGLDLHVVYRKPNNPGVDGLLRYARSSGCIGQIEKGSEGAREIVSVLRKGGVIGMLVDQKLNEGLPIPFFGRDAMTAPAIAHFALKFKCPIYPFRVERLSDCKYRITILEALKVANTGNKTRDVTRILTDINALLESWIRATPEQWLWIHRRWPKQIYREA
jgi:KDO2-lipid IV(A) lauroyltransferase